MGSPHQRHPPLCGLREAEVSVWVLGVKPENREGMVTVYDDQGRYAGCMGRETWDWLLARGHSKSSIAAENERLREALEEVMPESHHPTCAVYLPQEECDCGYDLAEAALARIPESKES